MSRLTFLLVVMSVTWPAYSADMAVLSGAVPTSSDLSTRYNDRTWSWGEDKGVYFSPDGSFQSFVSESSYASGRWTTGDDGRLCLSGDWYTKGKPWPFEDCFQHRYEDEILYLRKLPSGDWKKFWSEGLVTGNTIKPLLANLPK